MIAVAGGLALAGFTTPAARAATITPNLAPGGGFDWTYSDTSSSNQPQVSGDLFITSSSFGPASVTGRRSGARERRECSPSASAAAPG